MCAARILYGKPVQEAILEEVRHGVEELAAAGLRAPKLAALLVGDDPASAIYVRSKTRMCRETGLDSEAFQLPASTSTPPTSFDSQPNPDTDTV